MVETTQQAASPPSYLLNPLAGESTTSQAGMPSLVELVEPTKLQEVPSTSPRKNILVEKIFQNISKQMLENSYTLNFEQLIKISPDLKKYVWQKLKVDNPQINIRPMNE